MVKRGLEGTSRILDPEVFVIQDIDRAFAGGRVLDRYAPWLVELPQTRSRNALLADIGPPGFAYLENRAALRRRLRTREAVMIRRSRSPATKPGTGEVCNGWLSTVLLPPALCAVTEHWKYHRRRGKVGAVAS